MLCYLFSEDIGEGTAHHEDDKEKQHEDIVGQQEALDLFHCSKAAKAREKDHEGWGNQDDVGCVHVEPVPEEFL